jgi:hypothetical protein
MVNPQMHGKKEAGNSRNAGGNIIVPVWKRTGKVPTVSDLHFSEGDARNIDKYIIILSGHVKFHEEK